MFEVTTVGVDLAKNAIQIHGVDADGKVVVRRRSLIMSFTNRGETRKCRAASR